MGTKAFLALGVLTLIVLGIAGVTAFFAARDGATVPAQTPAPGTARGANTDPIVAPGNIVLGYSDERLTRELEQVVLRSAGAPSPALVAAGQAILVARRPGQRPAVVAYTATRRHEAGGPQDPGLRRFIEYWLGRRQ